MRIENLPKIAGITIFYFIFLCIFVYHNARRKLKYINNISYVKT